MLFKKLVFPLIFQLYLMSITTNSTYTQSILLFHCHYLDKRPDCNCQMMPNKTERSWQFPILSWKKLTAFLPLSSSFLLIEIGLVLEAALMGWSILGALNNTKLRIETYDNDGTGGRTHDIYIYMHSYTCMHNDDIEKGCLLQGWQLRMRW